MIAASPYDRLSSEAASAAMRELETFDEEHAPAAAAKARLLLPPDLTGPALSTAFARRRAKRSGKFTHPEAMLFTRAGYEQATSSAVARHRAEHLALRGCIIDLCCGIGSDSIALALAGAYVRGVDRDADAVACARHNARALGAGHRVTFAVADACTMPLVGADAAFADPSRRSGSRRIQDPSDYQPALETLLARARELPGGALCVKAAPGIDVGDTRLRVALGGLPFAVEWISEGGTCKEATLYCGDLAEADGARRATVIAAGAVHSFEGDPMLRAPTAALGRFVGEPDPAAIRSGLLGALCVRAGWAVMDERVAYLTAVEAPPVSPFVRWYRVADAMPFGVKRVRAYLRERGIGRLVLKTRAFPLSPEAVTALLKPAGDARATIICTTLGKRKTAIVCEPVPGETGRIKVDPYTD